VLGHACTDQTAQEERAYIDRAVDRGFPGLQVTLRKTKGPEKGVKRAEPRSGI
jgi:hypothetical protein